MKIELSKPLFCTLKYYVKTIGKLSKRFYDVNKKYNSPKPYLQRKAQHANHVSVPKHSTFSIKLLNYIGLRRFN